MSRQSKHEIAIEVIGDELTQLHLEGCGHRIQRIPPTERRGRVHTSTVTVAVMDPAVSVDPALQRRGDGDFRIEWFSGSGAGGQHRNKTQNSCRIIHVPTGMMRAAQTRSRESSQREAMTALLAALDEAESAARHGTLAGDRRAQVGSGQRGDKGRTYRQRDNRVTDHRTGKTTGFDTVMRGNFDQLW